MSTEPISKARLEELIDAMRAQRDGPDYLTKWSVDDVVTALRDYARLREENVWQPIETAPKDYETRVIGLVGKRACTVQRSRRDVYAANGDGSSRVIDTVDSGWNEICYDALIPQRPTHWMPLPQGPRHE